LKACEAAIEDREATGSAEERSEEGRTGQTSRYENQHGIGLSVSKRAGIEPSPDNPAIVAAATRHPHTLGATRAGRVEGVKRGDDDREVGGELHKTDTLGIDQGQQP
jgi:hypothetical protein